MAVTPERAPVDVWAEEDPIVALATPWGESALAVVRATGTGCLGLAAALFRGHRAPDAVPGYTLIHGRLVDPAGGEPIDEVLLAVFRGPRSYTGQDAVEVSCHGGTAVVSRVLGLFLANGFRQAGPGEFTLRAFLNGRMDLTRAEAVNEIVRARSDRARALALARLSGAVADRVEAIKGRAVLLAGRVEVSLDYPEDEIDAPPPEAAEARAMGRDIGRLLATYDAGRLQQEGARVAIAGRANAGKSTLFNVLLREDRSIVSALPGTTRDYIESSATVDGVWCRLFDTAGLRTAEGEVEREGIRRTIGIVAGADVVLYLVDATAGVHDEDLAAMAGVEPGRIVRLWTKADLAVSPPPPGYLAVSALRGSGMAEAKAAILARLPQAGGGADAPVIDSLRQKLLLERARLAMDRAAAALEGAVPFDLVAVDLREAVDALGEITGAVTTADLLATVFASFCVGK